MKKTLVLAAAVAFSVGASVAQAQQSQYPLMDRMAGQIVHKYQSSSCQQLAAERKAAANGQKDPQKDQMKAKIAQQLRQDPGMRAAFVSKVSGPIVDKMIVCGFVP